MSKPNPGWVVVGAGAAITCIAVGALLSLPVFLTPIAVETGWSRAGIGFAITLNFLAMGIASFGWGSLSDRHGPRPVVMTGVSLLCLGLLWISRASSLLEFQFVYGIVLGVAGGSLVAPLISTVTLWFDEHRALAVSLVSAGMAVAPMTVSPLAQLLIAEHGWRTTEQILAVAIAVLLLPAAMLVRRPPHFETPKAGSEAAGELRTLAGAALRSRPFAVLALTFFACCATHSGPIIHTVSYAIVCGLPAMTAVTIYSVEGFAGLIGRLAFGALADRFGIKLMIVAGLLTQALMAGAYALVARLGEFYAVAFVFGLAYGGVMPLYAALARSYFAPQIMGTVLGAMTLASGFGMALGPALGGWIFDTQHSYAWMYIGSLLVGLGAVGIALALPRPRGGSTGALSAAG